MKKLILFSGGMDSSLLLASAQWSGDTPIPLFIDYGQPHLDRELAAARSQVGDALMMRSVALDGGIVARASRRHRGAHRIARPPVETGACLQNITGRLEYRRTSWRA